MCAFLFRGRFQMGGIMRFRHNVINVDSFADFESIRGGVNQNCRDVCPVCWGKREDSI